MTRSTRRRPARVIPAAILASTLLLAGCTGQSRVVEGTEVTVAAPQPFYSYNGNTSYGSNPTANGALISATNSQFFSYDEVPELVADESFGTVSVVSESPLSVRYTIRDGVTWSDGVPVDAADLLLAWVANSGALNSPGFDDTPYLDPATQQYTADFPRDVVFFDGSTGGGLQLVSATPQIDDRSITLRFDDYFVDWRLVFDVGLPAHVVAMNALGIDDPGEAKAAMIEAIQENDERALAPISRFWNSGFNFSETPDDPALLVSTGPYTITELDEESATLEANPRYRGDHRPAYETVTVRYISDPLQAASALADGEVDVIAPQPSVDVAELLAGLDDVMVESGIEGSYERLDLQFERGRNGTFDDPLVRKAFLKVVPRQQILEELVTPLREDARLRSSHVLLPGSDGYVEAVRSNGSAEYRRVDVAGAKKLLDRAGVHRPEVCILFDPSNPRRSTEFRLIQSSAAEAGFRVTDCSSPNWRDLLGVPRQYDASLYALRSTNLAVTAARASFASSNAVNNTSFYANPRVDELLDELDRAPRGTERTEILTEIDRLVWADAFGVPLYQFPSITAFRSDVEGVAPSPLAPGVLWNVWDWKPAAGG